MTRALLIGLLAGLVSGLTFAPAAIAQEDPYALIRKTDAALREAGGIRYTGVRTGHGFIASQGPSSSGTVTASMADGNLRFRIEGQEHRVDGTRPEFLAAYDGNNATAIRHADKIAQTGPLDSTYGVLAGAGAGLVSWLLLWEEHIGGAFRDDEQPYTLEYEGQVLVGEKACHLVRLSFNEYWGVDEFETWLYLDTENLLPRRIELGYYSDWGLMGMVHVAMDNVELLESVDTQMFTAAVLLGYEVVEYKAAADVGGRPARAQPIAVGAVAPEWILQDVNGNDFALADYRGRVVVMDFWATWCGPCIMAMPGLQELHEEFKDQPVSIVGINCWESGDPADFMHKKGFTYGLLLGGDQVATAYGVEGIPTFYVIGKDGTVVFHKVGYDPDGTNKIREVIKKALAE